MEKFSNLQYVRPDFKALSQQIKAYTKQLKKAETYEQFKEIFKKIETTFVVSYDAHTIASIRNTMDKTDKFYEEEMKYLSKNSPKLSLTMVGCYKTLLKSKFRPQFDEEFGSFLTRKIEESLKLSKPLALLLQVKEDTLAQQYSKDAAMCKTTFKGEECNFYGLLKHMQSTDRSERKEAFEAWASLYESVGDKLDATYDKLIPIRIKMAKFCGYDNYIDYIYKARERYDYTSADIAKFRKNVAEIIVPVCQEINRKRAQRLGIDKLHYYDEQLTYPHGNPLPQGNKDELVAKAKKMYEEMSKETAEYFNFMCDHELFDLETRPGKHLGGYCTFIPSVKAPFIFSNFNGTSADVDVLTHEAGHAFEAYTASRIQKSLLTTSSTSEINEIHSMAMETFAYPWMEGFFKEDADKYRYHHLTDSLMVIPYMCAVDEFQHKVFENPKMSAQERKQVWHQLEQVYLPWRDYDGNKFLEEGGFWMQKQHIFLYPFYYIDYALAQICAFQFFTRSLKDRQEAWDSYVNLCKAGGSEGYFKLLESANLKNPFKKETMQEVVDDIVKVINEYETKI